MKKGRMNHSSKHSHDGQTAAVAAPAQPSPPAHSPTDPDIAGAIIQQLSDMALAINTEGRILYANLTCAPENWQGRPLAELLARVELYTPDLSPLPYERIPLVQALAGENVRDFLCLVRLGNEGPLHLQSVSAAPIRAKDGAIIGAASVGRDISAEWRLRRQEAEMAQARQAAEQAGARLRALFDTIADPVLMADTNGRLVETNAAGRQYLGNLPEEAPLPTLAEYLMSHRMYTQDHLPVPPEMRPIVRALAGEVIHGQEVRVVFPEGREMWALIHAAPVRAEDGRILGSALTLHDVTDLHQARQELEQAYQQAQAERQILENVFDNIPYTHVALFDQHGRLVRINPDGPRLMGYETADAFRAALARPQEWQMLRDNVSISPDQWPLTRALRGERFDSQEYHVLTPDGYEAHFLMNGGPVAWDEDGNVTLAVNVGHDVRELRRLMDEAERERAQYRTLTESIPQFVWSATPDGKAVYFNAHWEAFTGTPTDQLLGDGWLQDIHPQDRERVAAAWAAACAAGADYEVEYRLRGKGGIYRHFLARGTRVNDSRGRCLQIVGTTTDITDPVRDRNRNRLLRQIGDSLRASLHPDDVLRATTGILGRFLKASRAYYSVVGPAAQEISILSEYTRDAARPSVLGTYPLPGDNPFAKALMSGQNMIISDVRKDPLTRPVQDRFLRYRIRSLIGIPIVEGARWVATLFVADDAPRQWTEEEVELTELVAERARLAVENARLYQAEREQTQRLAEAFAETHHRVKNNLQVIAALLDMRLMESEGDSAPISRRDLGRMVGHVRAIAAVHDFLSHHQAAMTVSAREVVKRLVPMAIQTADIHTEWQSDDAVLSVKQGTALALILNELLSNASKHGAQRAWVTLRRTGDACQLEVSDDGPGFPPDFNPERDAHQGLDLVTTLAERDLQGRISFGNTPAAGGCVQIHFTVEADASAK